MPSIREELTPREIVAELDKYIIGQDEAKRCVAVALRNRYRRKNLPENLQDEVTPKNIIMIGPTGVGKTEIARRLAKLVNAPFVKVEATKFTEVGYVGRDVESMVRDLVETSIRIVQGERMQEVEGKAAAAAETRILELLAPMPRKKQKASNPFSFLLSGASGKDTEGGEEEPEDTRYQERVERARNEREIIKEKLKRMEMEEYLVEIEMEDRRPPVVEVFSGYGMDEMGININDMLGNMFPTKKKKKKVAVKDARKILQTEEAQKMIDFEAVTSEAIERAEQLGIIFLDEIDKIAGKDGRSSGPDVSREGVQRDILPIVEGSTVMTKHGPVKTDHVLFVAAGAFTMSKPSELIPELQGRFPIRVELNSLTTDDFIRILTEPKNALSRQYTALLATENVNIIFSDDAIKEISRIAGQVNQDMENIGARRLHTIMEKLLDDISFDAPEREGEEITIDEEYVMYKLKNIVKNKDLSKYIL